MDLFPTLLVFRSLRGPSMLKIKEKQLMLQLEELLKALGQDLSGSSTNMLYKYLTKLILKYRLKDASSCHLMNF